MNSDNNTLDMAIMLTATIIPMTTDSQYSNVEARRNEYLQAIRFYSQFGTVFFLENSTYDLLHDSEFLSIPNVFYRKMPIDNNPEHAKGWQEFHMIDQWVETESNMPKRWIKVSGRYIFDNFIDIYKQCKQTERSIIMDLNASERYAATYLFYVTTDCYKEFFMGTYCLCRNFLPIEKIIYILLRYIKFHDISIFSQEPNYSVISGGNNKSIHRKSQLRLFFLNIIRKINLKIYPYALIFYIPGLSFLKRIINFILEIIYIHAVEKKNLKDYSKKGKINKYWQ